jgi:hypothetical protein
VAELVGADAPIDIPRVNVGADKEYAALYDSFTRALHPSAEVVERACSSRLVQHFYSRAEIDRFRERWLGGARHEAAR